MPIWLRAASPEASRALVKIWRPDVHAESEAVRRRGQQLAASAQTSAEHRLVNHSSTSALVVLAQNVIKLQSIERASLAAAGTAFWLVIALFPALISVICIFGLFIDPQQVVKILGNLSLFEPNAATAAAGKQLQSFAQSDQRSLSMSLAVSLTITLWSVSAGTYGLARAIRLSYGLAPQNWVVSRAKSLAAAAVGVFALGVIAIAATVAAYVNTLVSGFWQVVVTAVIEVPVALVFITVTVAANYRYAIAQKTGLRPLLPGAIGSAIALMLLVYGYQIYLDNWANYTHVYGATAGVVIMLLLAYMCMYVVVIGGIVNAVLRDNPASRPWSWFSPRRPTAETAPDDLGPTVGTGAEDSGEVSPQ